MYSFTCWSVAGRPGTSDLLLEARVRSCTHTPRPKGRIKPARRFGRTTAGLRPPCVRPNRPTNVSLTGQGCCRARVGGVSVQIAERSKHGKHAGKYVCDPPGTNDHGIPFDTLDEVAAYLRANP